MKNVIVFKALPADQIERIRAEHHVVLVDPKIALEDFHRALPEAHGLIGASYPLTAELLAKASRLEVVSSASVGVDNYDLAELHRRSILLCHTPGVLDETVADTVFGLLVATSRRFVEMSNLVREGKWPQEFGDDLLGVDVHGRTLGMIGFGRIGQAIARRAALGFRMNVLYHTRHAVDLDNDAPELAGKETHAVLHELLAKSDFVVGMLSLTDATRGMMGTDFFGAMKPGAIFINGGRGATVCEDALLSALSSGRLRAAGLDVFAKEPLGLESPLRTHARVTPLPHIGSATIETRRAMAVLATNNLLQALSGVRPATCYDTANV